MGQPLELKTQDHSFIGLEPRTRSTRPNPLLFLALAFGSFAYAVQHQQEKKRKLQDNRIPHPNPLIPPSHHPDQNKATPNPYQQSFRES